MDALVETVLKSQQPHLTREQILAVKTALTEVTSKWVTKPNSEMEVIGLVLELEKSKADMFAVVPSPSQVHAAWLHLNPEQISGPERLGLTRKIAGMSDAQKVEIFERTKQGGFKPENHAVPKIDSVKSPQASVDMTNGDSIIAHFASQPRYSDIWTWNPIKRFDLIQRYRREHGCDGRSGAPLPDAPKALSPSEYKDLTGRDMSPSERLHWARTHGNKRNPAAGVVPDPRPDPNTSPVRPSSTTSHLFRAGGASAIDRARRNAKEKV